MPADLVSDHHGPVPHGSILAVVLVYAIFATLWILLSDKVVEWLFSDPVKITLASSIKGGLFVAITSVLLYRLMRRWAGARAAVAPPASSLRHLVWPFALLATAILALAASAISHTFSQQRDQEVAHLLAIADLRTQQIADWLKERRGDAEFVSNSALFATDYRRWRETGDNASRDRLQAQLAEWGQNRGLATVMLLDAQGQRLWGSALAPPTIAPALLDAARQTVIKQRTSLAGPYRDQGGLLRLDFLAPLAPAGVPPALVVLQTDPADWLYRTLLDWPTPSASGETMIFRRNGDQVRFLNALRFRPESAAETHQPLATYDLLAAQVLRGEIGPGRLIRGKDYRGVAVLGVAQAIPGTDWFLIAKMDRAEFYGDATRNALWIGLATMLALFTAAAALYLLRQRQQLALAEGLRQSQEARLHSLQLLTAITDSSVDAIFAKDLEGRYMLFNRAASRFVGKPAEAVLGGDDRALFPADQAEMLMAVGRRVVEESRIITQEETLDTPAGKRDFLVTKGPLHDDGGQAIGSFGISRDITERKQAEQALRESEGRFRALVEQSMAGIYIIQDNRFAYVNPGFARLFGYDSAQELVDRVPVADLISPEDRARVAENIRRRVEGEVSDIHYTFTGLHRDGNRFDVEVHGRRFNYRGRPAVIGFLLDITDSKAAEADLRLRNEELERFNRASVGRELDMIELKREINALSSRLGQPPPYPLDFIGQAGTATPEATP